ncbi:hypothetical protein B0H10DRAFT_2446657 [Mycena sp. CBHHK59/15]|nr:hypothetical protein B0H10DRAFT_2446657 [Mycena sp. CBHHK59/15]
MPASTKTPATAKPPRKTKAADGDPWAPATSKKVPAARKPKKKTGNTEDADREVAPPADSGTSKHFLGFASASIIMKTLGQGGPKITFEDHQRVRNNTSFKGLMTTAREDGAGLARQDPDHALTFAIDPNLLDPACLIKEHDGTFKPIAFKAGKVVDTSKGRLYSGYHRILVLEHVFEPRLYAYEQAHELAESQPENLVAVADRDARRDALHNEGTWLVSLYDENFTDDENAESIRLKLSTNNVLAAVQDSPRAHFNNILRGLRNSKTDKARNMVRKQALTNSPDMVTTILNKHYDVLRCFTYLNEIPAFANRGLEPKHMLEAKQTFWACFEPFLSGGYLQLVYILSDSEYLPSTDDLTSETRATISKQLAADMKLKNSMLADELVEIFDTRFKAFLLAEMEYFGHKGSEKWTEAMRLYCQHVLKDVQELVDLQTTGKEDPVLSRLHKKVNRVLGGAMNGGPFVPFGGREVPLLCPSFAMALFTLFQTLAPGIRLIAGWMVPGMTDYEERRAKGEDVVDKKLCTPSHSCLILRNLAFFQYYLNSKEFKGHFETSTLVPDNGLVYYAPDGDLTSVRTEVAILWAKVVEFILRYRTFTLLLWSPEIEVALALCKLSKDQQAKAQFQYNDTQVAGIGRTIQLWLVQAKADQEGSLGSKVKLTEVLRQAAQTCPTELYANKPDHMFIKQPELLRALECASFNFLTSTKGNSTARARNKFVQAIRREIGCNEEFLDPLLTASPKLYVFRAYLRRMIQSHGDDSSWDSWQYWHSIPKALRPVFRGQGVSRPDEPTDYGIAHQVVIRQRRPFKTDLKRSFQRLLDGINKRGLCAVGVQRDEDNSGELVNNALHPAVAAAFSHLWAVASAVQEDAANIETDPLAAPHSINFVEWFEPQGHITNDGFHCKQADLKDCSEYYPTTGFRIPTLLL